MKVAVRPVEVPTKPVFWLGKSNLAVDKNLACGVVGGHFGFDSDSGCDVVGDVGCLDESFRFAESPSADVQCFWSGAVELDVGKWVAL